MPDTLDLAPYLGSVLACAGGAAAVGTPLLWRGLRRKPRATRIWLTMGGSITLAVLAGLMLELSNPSGNEMMSILAPILALLLQLLILPLLLFLSRGRGSG